MPAYLIFEDKPFYFEVVTTEQAEYTANVTEHPVEKGANIADHVRDQLDQVTLEVFVSNTPLADVNDLYQPIVYSWVQLDVPDKPPRSLLSPGALYAAAGTAIADLVKKVTGDEDAPPKVAIVAWPTKFDALKDALDKLIDWKKRGVLGQVVLPNRLHESMVITSVSITRNEPIDGGSIHIQFKEVRTVEVALTTAPVPTEKRAETKVAKGTQTVKEVDQKSVKKALLLSAAQHFGYFGGEGAPAQAPQFAP